VVCPLPPSKKKEEKKKKGKVASLEIFYLVDFVPPQYTLNLLYILQVL